MHGRMMAGACLFGILAGMGDTAKIAACVLDAETRRPLAGVEMCALFERDNGWGAWKGSPSPVEVKCSTDREGMCRAEGRTNNGRAWWTVEKVPDGYYRPAHGGGWTFERRNLFGTWQPDDAVSTVLVQRVGRPVPLIGRRQRTDVVTPAGVDLVGKAGGRLAYDFLRGDWLPPVGKGVTADMEFVRNERTRVAVRFPGADNGIVELTPPDYAVPLVRTAPEDGYRPGFDIVHVDDGEHATSGGRCYAFRVRARRDAEGRLVDALYGKFYGPIQIVCAKGAQPGAVEPLGEPWFGYFLNPAPLDRNLEWDRETLLRWSAKSQKLEPAELDARHYPCRGTSGPEP